MSLKYVLSQVGAKVGLNPNAQASRAVLLRFANEAADELWSECDITGSIMEQVFRVNGNQTIAMPIEVGAIRACRELYSQNPIHLNQMRARYNMYNWKDGWYNYRLKNTQALMRTITNFAPLTYTVSSLDSPPLTVSVSGTTDNANYITETITIDALSKEGSLNFTSIEAVTKSAVGGSDVTVSDCEGNVLSVIGNNKLEARYQILDISQAPWLADAKPGTIDNYVEILYKKSLPQFSNDGDEFPAQGYDNQWVNKCLQLWYEEQGKGDVAQAYDAKATRGLARKKEEQNKATEDIVAFTTNDYDTLQPRIRGSRFTRWTGWRRR